MVQCVRTHLPMQGTRVQSPGQKDPTCHRATRPVCHNYWACVLQLLEPTCQEPVLHDKRSHHSDKAHAPQLESSPQPLQPEKAQHSQWLNKKTHQLYENVSYLSDVSSWLNSGFGTSLAVQWYVSSCTVPPFFSWDFGSSVLSLLWILYLRVDYLALLPLVVI